MCSKVEVSSRQRAYERARDLAVKKPSLSTTALAKELDYSYSVVCNAILHYKNSISEFADDVLYAALIEKKKDIFYPYTYDNLKVDLGVGRDRIKSLVNRNKEYEELLPVNARKEHKRVAMLLNAKEEAERDKQKRLDERYKNSPVKYKDRPCSKPKEAKVSLDDLIKTSQKDYEENISTNLFPNNNIGEDPSKLISKAIAQLAKNSEQLGYSEKTNNALALLIQAQNILNN